MIKLDLDEEGSIKHDQKSLFIFWAIRNTKGGNKGLFLNDEHLQPKDPSKVKPYLEIEFLQEKIDWFKFMRHRTL